MWRFWQLPALTKDRSDFNRMSIVHSGVKLRILPEELPHADLLIVHTADRGEEFRQLRFDGPVEMSAGGKITLRDGEIQPRGGERRPLDAGLSSIAPA